MTNPLSADQIRAEFNLATANMTFKTDEEKALRNLFFRYFLAGAMFAERHYNQARIILDPEISINPIKNQ